MKVQYFANCPRFDFSWYCRPSKRSQCTLRKSSCSNATSPPRNKCTCSRFGPSSLVGSHSHNTAARIITFTCKYDHITPVLVRLHWLPVSYRIRFKVLLLTYKALNDLSPEYISELLNKPKYTRNLRSQSQHLLSVPKSRTVTYDDRAFSVCAPKLYYFTYYYVFSFVFYFFFVVCKM